MAINIFTYAEQLDKVYSQDPNYREFAVLINMLPYNQGMPLALDFCELNYDYYQLVGKAKNYQFSEEDYSFAGFMDFLKGIGSKAAEQLEKGTERHQQALEKFTDKFGFDPEEALRNITDPSKAQEFLRDLYDQTTSKISDKQYRQMLADADDEAEYGKIGKYLAKGARAIDKGWERDNIAKAAATGGGLGLMKLLGVDPEAVDYLTEKAKDRSAVATGARGADKENFLKFLKDKKAGGESTSSNPRYYDNLPTSSTDKRPPASDDSLIELEDFEPSKEVKNTQLGSQFRKARQSAPKAGSDLQSQLRNYISGVNQAAAGDDEGSAENITVNQNRLAQWARDGFGEKLSYALGDFDPDDPYAKEGRNAAIHAQEDASLTPASAAGIGGLEMVSAQNVTRDPVGSRQVKYRGGMIVPPSNKSKPESKMSAEDARSIMEQNLLNRYEEIIDSGGVLNDTQAKIYEQLTGQPYEERMRIDSQLAANKVRRELGELPPEFEVGDYTEDETLMEFMEYAKCGMEEGYSMSDCMKAYSAMIDDPSYSGCASKKSYAEQKEMTKEDKAKKAKMTHGEKSMKYAEQYFVETNPKKKAALAKKAETHALLMNYAEAIADGRHGYAKEMLKTAQEIVQEYEGLAYSDSGRTVAEILTAAADYVYAEDDPGIEKRLQDLMKRRMKAGKEYNDLIKRSDTDEEKEKLAKAWQKEQDEYDKKEKELKGGTYAEDEAELDQKTVSKMISAMPEEDKKMLFEALKADLASMESEEEEEESDESELEMPPAKEEDEEDKEKGEFSESLRKEDEAIEQFYKESREAIAQFSEVDELYNTPLQFSEGVAYDFSEWVDSFKKANSAALNLYGYESGFNGKLPQNIVVVKSEHPEAAWSVYDSEGQFVTLAGTKAFTAPSFSETLRNEYCSASKGSRMKSDRIARTALCLK